MYDYIVVGSGFAGATIAERLANILDKKVLVIEKRNHIGGNMYDFIDKNGLLCHKYGPHFFLSKKDKVWEYLSKFGEWYDCAANISTLINNTYVPMPFDLRTVDALFSSEQSKVIKEELIKKYGYGSSVSILDILKDENPLINMFGKEFYEKDSKGYNQKQWGLSPQELDKSVSARTPIWISENGLNSTNYSYNKLPVNGYVSIFNKMLENPNINILLNTDANSLLRFDNDNGLIYFKGMFFNGIIIYTGAVDELFNYRFGTLPYRSLEFIYENISMDRYLPACAVYYPSLDVPYTRISEYKFVMKVPPQINITSIAKEIPLAYDKNNSKGNIPYYPILNEANQNLYKKYAQHAKNFKNLYLVGRLAEYKYYNMDAVIEKALSTFEVIKKL